MTGIYICISSGPEFLRHELNNRFLQSHADRIPPGMRTSQLMHYESHQHHHQHLHQHQHQHQHFHSNGAPLSTPQVPQAVVSTCTRGMGVSHAQGRGEERWVVLCWVLVLWRLRCLRPHWSVVRWIIRAKSG